MADEPAPVVETQAPAPAARSSRGGRLLTLAFVAGVVLIECLVAYLCLPSPAQSEALAGAAAQGAQEHARQEEQKDKEKKETVAEQSEVDLGQFTVMAFQPSSSTTLRISLHLYGTVDANDAAEFNVRLKDSQHRFRDQVIVTLRSAEITDLTDAGLGLLKRTILEKTNTTLGKSLLKMVIFSDFSFVELQ